MVLLNVWMKQCRFIIVKYLKLDFNDYEKLNEMDTLEECKQTAKEFLNEGLNIKMLPDMLKEAGFSEENIRNALAGINPQLIKNVKPTSQQTDMGTENFILKHWFLLFLGLAAVCFAIMYIVSPAFAESAAAIAIVLVPKALILGTIVKMMSGAMCATENFNNSWSKNLFFGAVLAALSAIMSFHTILISFFSICTMLFVLLPLMMFYPLKFHQALMVLLCLDVASFLYGLSLTYLVVKLVTKIGA
jgi:hypothetical protein